MKRKSLLFALTALPLFAYSQYAYLPDYNWGGNIGGTGIERANHVTTDLYGDVIVDGKFNSPTDFDIASSVNSVVNSGYFDAYISKYSPSGSLIWVKTIAANANSNESPYINSTVTDSSGNIYITGSFKGSIDFDPSPTGSRILTSNGESDIFVLKLDRNGTLVWAGNMGSDESDVGNGLTVDSQDNVYVTGSFRKTVDFDMTSGILNLTSEATDTTFIIKLDKNGTIIWGKATQGTGADGGNSVAVDSAFNVFVTGINVGITDFNPNPSSTFNLISAFEGQFFIWKLDSSGNFLNAGVTTPSNTVYPSRANKIKIDSNNNVLVAGAFYGTIDFDFGPVNNSMNAMGTGCCSDAFILKVDNDLNYIWARKMGSTVSDMAYGLALDQNNNILSTGFMVGVVVNDTSGRSENEAFIWALDPAGNQIDLEDYVGGGDDEGREITVDKAGNIYTVGTFNYNLKDMNIFNYTSKGNSDGFIFKLGNVASPVPSVLPPTAVNDVLSVSGSSSHLFNVASNDQGVSASYTIKIVSYPLFGTLTVNSNGTLTYLPNAGNPGTDSFQYTVENSNGLVSNVASAVITSGNLSTVDVVAGQKVSVYPNPADTVLFIRSFQEVDSATIFDMAGRKINEVKGSRRINVSALVAGMYVITVKMKNGKNLRQTFIKK